MPAVSGRPRVIGMLAVVTWAGWMERAWRRRARKRAPPLGFFSGAMAFRALPRPWLTVSARVGTPMTRAKAEPSTPASAAATEIIVGSRDGGFPAGADAILAMK